MTETVRDQIDDKVEAALTDLVADGAIEFEPSGDPAVFPGLAVFSREDRLVGGDWQISRFERDLSVEGYVDAAGGRAGTKARNLLHAQAVAALMADDTLGGTVESIMPGDRRDTTLRFDVGQRLTFAQDFTIQFTTLRVDPAQAA